LVELYEEGTEPDNLEEFLPIILYLLIRYLKVSLGVPINID